MKRIQERGALAEVRKSLHLRAVGEVARELDALEGLHFARPLQLPDFRMESTGRLRRERIGNSDQSSTAHQVCSLRKKLGVVSPAIQPWHLPPVVGGGVLAEQREGLDYWLALHMARRGGTGRAEFVVV
eukprot:TRINITY_DN42841_c0_g1_i2.p2 TRINITY_DN42841_c0_g1~~TRINITY_DN42841_c0_g1_i2.p2  ORF type:complete len:129 (-),score=19.06 TRINITY_DN42841_c0_g1_i2:163-549(-)